MGLTSDLQQSGYIRKAGTTSPAPTYSYTAKPKKTKTKKTVKATPRAKEILSQAYPVEAGQVSEVIDSPKITHTETVTPTQEQYIYEDEAGRKYSMSPSKAQETGFVEARTGRGVSIDPGVAAQDPNIIPRREYERRQISKQLYFEQPTQKLTSNVMHKADTPYKRPNPYWKGIKEGAYGFYKIDFGTEKEAYAWALTATPADVEYQKKVAVGRDIGQIGGIGAMIGSIVLAPSFIGSRVGGLLLRGGGWPGRTARSIIGTEAIITGTTGIREQNAPYVYREQYFTQTDVEIFRRAEEYRYEQIQTESSVGKTFAKYAGKVPIVGEKIQEPAGKLGGSFEAFANKIPFVRTKKEEFRDALRTEYDKHYTPRDIDTAIRAQEYQVRSAQMAEFSALLNIGRSTELYGAKGISASWKKLTDTYRTGKLGAFKPTWKSLWTFTKEGAREGGISSLAEQRAYRTPYSELSYKEVGYGAGFGAVSATLVGGGIVFTSVAGMKKSGAMLRTFGNIADITEKPSDLLASAQRRTFRSTRRHFPEPKVYTVPGAKVGLQKDTLAFNEKFYVPQATKATEVKAYTVGVTPTTTPTTAVNVPTTPSYTPSFTPTTTPTETVVGVPSYTPTHTTVPTTTSVTTQTNIPVSVIDIKIPGLIVPPFIRGHPGGGRYGRGRRRKLGKQVKKYTPSLTAIGFNIKGKTPKGKLTGLEFRPIPTKGVRKWRPRLSF